MTITETIIKNILHLVHSTLMIDNEATHNLISLFSQFKNLDSKQLLESLPGELKKHAQYEVNKYLEFRNDLKSSYKRFSNEKEVIIDYLLAEVLELAGNCTRDHRKIKVSSLHIWIAITCDMELKEVFPKQILPVLSTAFSQKALVTYGHHCRVKKNYVKELLASSGVKVSSDVFIIIVNILNELSNKYLTDEQIIKKINSLGGQKENNILPLFQLREIILNKLIEKLKALNCKITFNNLHNTVLSMQNELDYLF